ncbi:MAG: M48 family metalloprotease [candidate division Zixibacteria bacterium]|nr:M48 family metalloprotease [candidate division Zixibacteria bacterium]
MRHLTIIMMAVFLFSSFAYADDWTAENKPGFETLAEAESLLVHEQAGPVMVPEPTDKAMSYYHSGNILWVITFLWALIVPALLLFTGFSAKIRTFASRIGRKWFFTFAIYMAIVTVIIFLLDLPLDFYRGFIRQHAYGLSNQTFGKWFSDALKGLMVAVPMTIFIMVGPYLLLKYAPRRWWLWSGIGAVPIIIFLLIITPIYISPLFNDFGPMKDKELEAKILATAERAGIEGSRVFEVNKSVDTKAVNAYVTGFGGSKRIVLWDTLIEKLDDDEILFVMAHEMGHFVLKHVIWSVIFMSAVLMVALYLAHRFSGFIIRKYKHRFGFEKFSDIASYPLFIALVSIFMFLTTPVFNSYSRWHERQADQFGLEVTRNNRAAATAFIKLQTENLANPRPGWLYKLWRSDHPPIAERVDFVNEYRPWEYNGELRFGKYFK